MWCVIEWFLEFGEKYVDGVYGPFQDESSANLFIDSLRPRNRRVYCGAYRLENNS